MDDINKQTRVALFTLGGSPNQKPFWRYFWGILDIITLIILVFMLIWGGFLAPRYDITITTDNYGNIQNIVTNNPELQLNITPELQNKVKEKIS